jgi:hypothetical protein
MEHSLHETLATALAGIGQPSPADFIQTMLLKDGYFVGWNLRYDGGHVLIHSDRSVIELYDEQGTLLKTAALQGDQAAA